MMSADHWSADERRQVDGLREGVFHLDHLLQRLRDAVDRPPPGDAAGHVADDVERAVTAPHARLCVPTAGARGRDPIGGA